MRLSTITIAAALAAVATFQVATARAASGEDIFRTNCVSCHGKNGQGTPGLAPALKGDAFVVSGSIQDIENTIQNGRTGGQKHYKNLALSMPAWHLSPDDLKAVISYIRGDLQKD
jgi:cytochrome c oxidase cbb3-type subunit III